MTGSGQAGPVFGQPGPGSRRRPAGPAPSDGTLTAAPSGTRHELAHGLIGSTASFAATGEPGALGEGSTDYAAARTATIQSAIELYGASSAEATRVAAAWKAVNVG
ncbi:M4 family metallopeptidase [Streptomyces lavendulae]|uniref:M4 family metallopeptidase n=1 Tax=Streptomyces lavendulae TaxID=1914 RepID=UPI0032D9D2F2